MKSSEFNPDFWEKEDGKLTWWYRDPEGAEGEMLFSFDRKKVFNLFADYPYKLTSAQKKKFDKENPYWANFFSWRQ